MTTQQRIKERRRWFIELLAKGYTPDQIEAQIESELDWLEDSHEERLEMLAMINTMVVSERGAA